MYGYTSVLIMGEEKIRRNLGILPREKTKDINFPQLVKKKKTVRSALYKYPIIPFLFYGVAIIILIRGWFYVFDPLRLHSLKGLVI